MTLPDKPLPERPWFCEDCEKRLTTEEADVQTIRLTRGTHGEYFILSSLKLLDENPNILAARCPAWLVDELPRLKAMTPDALKREWDRRVAAFDEYRNRKAADPTVTVDA